MFGHSRRPCGFFRIFSRFRLCRALLLFFYIVLDRLFLYIFLYRAAFYLLFVKNNGSFRSRADKLFSLLFQLSFHYYAHYEICVVKEQQYQRQHYHQEEMSRILKPEYRTAHSRELSDVNAFYVARVKSFSDSRIGVFRIAPRNVFSYHGSARHFAFFNVYYTVSDELQIAADVVEISDYIADLKR